MRITVRLYKRHDLDLLSLYYIEDYDFKSKFNEALRGYINNEPIQNEIPTAENPSVSSLPSKIGFHIKLDEQDSDIYGFVQGITKGRRNNIMKNIFRNTFPPIVSPYKCASENNVYKMGDTL